MNDPCPLAHGSAFLLTQDARLASQVNASIAPLSRNVSVFSDELELLRSLRHSPCELLVFDASCVASDESSLLAWQRCHSGHPTPLIVLGRFDCANDILDWYRAGAQEVLALPFNPHELQVRAALALSPVAHACPETQQLSVGPYQLLRDENTVYLHGKPIVLTAREFSIAWLLFSSQACASGVASWPRRSGAATPNSPTAPWSSISTSCARNCSSAITTAQCASGPCIRMATSWSSRCKTKMQQR